MKYVSLIHALNLPCSLDTCGDWHTSALQWDSPNILERMIAYLKTMA